MRTFGTYFNYLNFELPVDCVEECSASGSVDSAVEYWQQQLKLNLNRNDMILELAEYGAWTDNELAELDDSELEQKLIWVGACDISERENI